MPIDWKYLISSPGGKCSDPLKSMCSRKWANPCCSSVSFRDPDKTTRCMLTRSLGSRFSRSTYLKPFFSLPKIRFGSGRRSLFSCGQTVERQGMVPAVGAATWSGCPEVECPAYVAGERGRVKIKRKVSKKRKIKVI
jgi:hypothetical protein